MLLIFSAFSSGSETGMMASNKVKLRNISKGSKGAMRALKLLQRPDVLLASILIGNNFANILFVFMASDPPFRITALPDLKHRLATSDVTLGLLSKITPITPIGIAVSYTHLTLPTKA